MGEIIPIRQAHMLPTNLGEASRIAEYIADSGLFGCKTKEQAFSLMLLADAEGLHPAAAARDYHIIEGRPSLKADAMLARYMAAGGKVEWLERSDTRVAAKFTHPSSGTVEIEWTIERAKRITRKGRSLTDGDNWRNYARQMLAARTISEGVRASYPGVVSGVYTPEEVQDFDDAPQPISQAAKPVVEIITEVEAAPAAPEPRQTTLPKADARAEFSALQEEIRNCRSAHELQEWGKLNAKRVALLPNDWKANLRSQYQDMLDGLKQSERAAAEANEAFEELTP